MNISKLYRAYIFFSIFFVQSGEIIIRPAELKDLPFLAALSKKIINEDFREILINGYPTSPVAQNPHVLETYLTNMTAAFGTIFEPKQLYDTRQRLFVAVQEKGNKSVIAGFCFSQQISKNQAYIRYIFVDSNYRHQGIGNILLTATLDSYPTISSCELRTFAHGNDTVHAFYEKYGFISDKIPAPLQRQYSEYSDTITFILYHLDIKKSNVEILCRP